MVKNKKLILFSLIAIGSLSFYLVNEFKKIKETKFKFLKNETEKLTFNDVKTKIFFNLFNKSNLTFNILNQTHAVFLYDNKIGVIKKLDKITIDPGENEIFFDLIFSPKEILKNLPITALKDENNIKIKSKLVLKIIFVNLNLYFETITSLKNIIK